MNFHYYSTTLTLKFTFDIPKKFDICKFVKLVLLRESFRGFDSVKFVDMLHEFSLIFQVSIFWTFFDLLIRLSFENMRD
jgi:hypothetical protein